MDGRLFSDEIKTVKFPFYKEINNIRLNVSAIGKNSILRSIISPNFTWNMPPKSNSILPITYQIVSYYELVMDMEGFDFEGRSHMNVGFIVLQSVYQIMCSNVFNDRTFIWYTGLKYNESYFHVGSAIKIESNVISKTRCNFWCARELFG